MAPHGSDELRCLPLYLLTEILGHCRLAVPRPSHSTPLLRHCVGAARFALPRRHCVGAARFALPPRGRGHQGGRLQEYSTDVLDVHFVSPMPAANTGSTPATLRMPPPNWRG